MSSRRVAELDDSALSSKHDPLSDPYADLRIPLAFEKMRDFGLPVEDITKRYQALSVKEDGNSAYEVMKVETLNYPIDIADAAADQTSMWVCTCPGWIFHHNADFPDDKRPSEVDDCPHVERCKRKEREAVDDENQASLGEVGD